MTPRVLPPEPDPGVEAPEEKPPFLGSWGALYALVVAELVAIILLCGWITRKYS